MRNGGRQCAELAFLAHWAWWNQYYRIVWLKAVRGKPYSDFWRRGSHRLANGKRSWLSSLAFELVRRSPSPTSGSTKGAVVQGVGAALRSHAAGRF